MGAWGFPSIVLTGQVLVPSLSCQPASASTLFHHVLMEQEGETSEGSHGSYPTLSQGAGECANRHPCPGWAKTTSAFFHLTCSLCVDSTDKSKGLNLAKLSVI